MPSSFFCFVLCFFSSLNWSTVCVFLSFLFSFLGAQQHQHPTATSRREREREKKKKNLSNMSSLSPFLFLFLSPVLISRHRLAAQSKEVFTWKSNPRQELSLPPMLVRKVCVNGEKKDDFSPAKKTQLTDGRTDGRRVCGVSFSLSLALSLSLAYDFLCSLGFLPVWSCSVCVTERKLSSPPSFPPFLPPPTLSV